MTPSASAPPRIPDNDRVLGRRLDSSVPYEPLRRPVPAGNASVSYDMLHDAANYHASRTRNDLSAAPRVVPGMTGGVAHDDMVRAFKEQTARYDLGAQRNVLQGAVGQPRAVESGDTLPLDVATTRSADAYLSTVAPVGPVQHQQPIGHNEDPLRQLVAAYKRGPTTHVELERRAHPPTVHVSRSEVVRGPVATGAAPHHTTVVRRSVPISTPPTRRIRGGVVVRPSGDVLDVRTSYAEIGELRATRRLAIPRAAPKADAATVGKYAEIGELHATRRIAIPAAAPTADAVTASVGPVRPKDVRGNHAVGLSVTCADRSAAFTSDRHDVSLTSSRSTPAGTARATHRGDTSRRHDDAVPVSHTGARRVSVHIPVLGGSQAAAPGAAAAAAAAASTTAAAATAVRRITDGHAATRAPTSAYRVHAWRDGEATTHRAGVAFPPRCSDITPSSR
jgi:hypothetical protein